MLSSILRCDQPITRSPVGGEAGELVRNPPYLGRQLALRIRREVQAGYPDSR
jgi:hypothetical protein